MDDQQERDVARGLREGKTEAWGTFYDAFAKRVWQAVSRRMGPNSPDVADVVQETFLAAARSAGTYDASRGSLWLWLSGIARRHVALHYRKQRRHRGLEDASHYSPTDGSPLARWLEGREDVPTESLVSAELAEQVWATLGGLPAEYETLLTAKYLDEISVDQLAGERKCSATAVRSKLARARRAFRRAFRRSSRIPPRSRAREDHES